MFEVSCWFCKGPDGIPEWVIRNKRCRVIKAKNREKVQRKLALKIQEYSFYMKIQTFNYDYIYLIHHVPEDNLYSSACCSAFKKSRYSSSILFKNKVYYIWAIKKLKSSDNSTVHNFTPELASTRNVCVENSL